MVRLRSPQRPPARSYFSGREQWRLFALVISLGLIVIFMNRLRQPETAEHLEWWMTGGEVAPLELDQSKSAGTFRTTPIADERQAERPAYYPGVRPEMLAAVRDNTYFRPAEADAWFHLLAILQNASPAELAAAAPATVDYVQLAQQPHVYRGRLVTVRGTVRQVTEQRPAENDLGLKSYYRLVIQPQGGGIWPIFVYALELPPSFPRSEAVAEEVAVTGFFFKDLSYAWTEGIGIAPVLLVKNITWPVKVAPAAAPPDAPRLPLAADSWTEDSQEKPNTAAASGPTLRELLALAGWDNERWAGFRDGAPLSDGERESLVALLRRLRTIDSFSLTQWAGSGPDWEVVLSQPAEHRGDVVALAGRVRRVKRIVLPPAEAARLELPEYFECEMQFTDGRAATILAARIPKAWLDMESLGVESLDEPASAAAVFIKTLPEQNNTQSAMFVAPRLAWHPAQAGGPGVSFGKSVLGTLGMDVGALDDVSNRDKILPTEREAFFEMLAAVGHIGANQLIRFAQDNLSAVEKNWAAVAKQRTAAEESAESAAERQRRLLALEVLRQAADGRYSVAPLFNDPDNQIGELVALDGTVRRAVRIEVGTAPDGRPSDVRERFGIDHYYELELFTDDSQNYPIVVCVRELPAGFPIGLDIREPVRVAGFFFKTWLYHTRKVAEGEPGTTASDSASQRQYAPLVIGPAPVWLLTTEETAAPYAGLLGGGLFVLALVGMWAAAWWYAREDRRFRDRVLARSYAIPEGQSLDRLEVPAGEPISEITGEGGQDRSCKT